MSKSNLVFYSDSIYSYQTCIATFKEGVAVMNETKYSVTTSKHQTKARVFLAQNCYKVQAVTGIRMGATPSDLLNAAKNITKL